MKISVPPGSEVIDTVATAESGCRSCCLWNAITGAAEELANSSALLYDSSVNYQDISERTSSLIQEIRDIREMNALYQGLNVQTQVDRAAHAEREIRLLQIKEELSRMMKSSRQKSDVALAIGREAVDIASYESKGN